jgi:hypothetical protein
MSQVSQAEAAASGGSARGNKDGANQQASGERFTPLLTREGHTFSLMRTDKHGPRMFSAICLPGWKQR